MKRFSPVSWAFLICFSVSAFAAPSPSFELKPHKASYKSNIQKGIKLKGKATRELKQLSESQWLYRFDVESFAADITESVRLEWDGTAVRPLDYDYLLSGLFIKDKYQKIKFDWSNNTATGKHNGKNWKVDLLDNSLDRLGYQLQLLVDVERQRSTQETKLMSYEILHRGKHRPSQFEIVGQETLSTRKGEWQTIKVIKKRAADKKRETTLWFSAEHPFLLMKMIQIEKDGERYELNLDNAEIDGNKIY